MSHKPKFINYKFDVDEGIYNLLKGIWNLGIHTEYSCEGDYKDRAYILFPSDIHAKWFAKLLDDNNLTCEFGFRGYAYGGGASVHFPSKHIAAIELLLVGLDRKEIRPNMIKIQHYVPKTISHLGWDNTSEVRLYGRPLQ